MPALGIQQDQLRQGFQGCDVSLRLGAILTEPWWQCILF